MVFAGDEIIFLIESYRGHTNLFSSIKSHWHQMGSLDHPKYDPSQNSNNLGRIFNQNFKSKRFSPKISYDSHFLKAKSILLNPRLLIKLSSRKRSEI